jgi:hypothetical protein
MSHIMHFRQFSGPFHCLPVISKFVASSDEWCDNNAFAAERVQMRGWTGATPTAAGRDVVSSGVWSEGALPGDRRLRAHMTAEVTIQRRGGGEGLWQK